MNFFSILIFIFLISCEEKYEPIEVDGNLQPPMPSKEERDKTILGVDSDNDGLRDDVEILINKIGDTRNRREALRQKHRYYQLAVSAYIAGDKKKALEKFLKSVESSTCMSAFYGSVVEKRVFRRKLDALTMNTKKRLDIYYKIDLLSAGIVTEGLPPKEWKTRCEFKVAEEEK